MSYFFYKTRSVHDSLVVKVLKLTEISSRGGLEVELWTDKSLPSASVDQILLGAMYAPACKQG